MSSDITMPTSSPPSSPQHNSGYIHSFHGMNPFTEYNTSGGGGYTSAYGMQQHQTVSPSAMNAPIMYSHMLSRQGSTSSYAPIHMNPWGSTNTMQMAEEDEAGGEMSDEYSSHRSSSKRHWGTGRKKIEIKFIEKKLKRQITFSKRKAGMMKKIHELTTLTGTEALLVLVSETGHVYTYATPKLDKLVKDPEKNIIKQTLDEYELNGKKD